MRRLSESDAAVLYADRPYAQNLLAPIGIYDPSTAPGGSVSFDDVLRFVGGRLDVARSFRERIVPVPFGLDRPNWAVDDDFDLEYHIRHIALPDPGDWSQLCTQVARIVARPLDMSRAPWELYVIERLGGIAGTAPGAFAVLLKLHHAAVDGATGAEIFTALHDTSPHRHTHRAAVALDDETSTDPLSLLVRAGIRAMVRPITALGTALPKIVRVVPGLVSEIRNGPEPSRTDLLTASPFNGQIGAHRSFGAVTVPLRTVKRIRSAVPGATVHDVTLAVVSGALRALLDERGDLPQASMLALTPISVHGTRGGDGDPHRPGGDVHRFRMAIASLATHLADPLARLQVIQHCTQVARERGAISAPSLLDIAEVLPGALMGTVQRAVLSSVNRAGRTMGFHTVIMNVPGPRVPLYFCGARATSLAGMAPVHDGMGLVHTVSSYDNEITISFTADRDMLPDPARYEACIAASVDELSRTTRSPRRREVP